jgi:hypothetical protein
LMGQVLVNQEWYVAPKVKWAEFWYHDLSVWSKIAEGEVSEMVLLYACWGICHQNIKGGGEGSEVVPNKK